MDGRVGGARHIVLVVLVCLTSLVSVAQQTGKGTEYAFWAGGNFTNGRVVGFVQDRRLVPFGIVWAPVLAHYRHFDIRYRVDLLPAVFLHDRHYVSPGQPPHPGLHWVYGAGASPVGMQVDIGAPRKIRPFFEVTGGFLYFESKILGYQTTQFNFTIAPGFGAHITVSPRAALILGYKYHHMSNANIYLANPGVDSQELYLGVSLFSR